MYAIIEDESHQFRVRECARIINQSEAKKIVIQMFHRRKNMRRKNGHRQPYTVVQIISLDLPV